MKELLEGKYALFLIAILVLSVLMAPKVLFAAPSISGVSGTVSNGQAITVSGTGFGSTGPTVVLFDDFELGTNGNMVITGTGSARVGAWTDRQNIVRYSNTYRKSGNLSMKVNFDREADGGDGSVSQMILSYNNVSTGVFLSYWVYLPTDKDVPGTNNGDGANWKQWWIWSHPWPQSDFLPVFLLDLPHPDEYANWGSADDIASPARWSGNWWRTGMTKGNWMRFDFYMKWSTSAGVMEAYEWRNAGRYTITNAQSAGRTAHDGEYWNRFTFPGYGRDDSNSIIYHDDIYFATGSAAKARIEICNSSTYTSASNCAISTTASWSDTSISATVRAGSFQSGQNAYLFVVDQSGGVSNGYPITIGSGAASPTSPTGLRVIN